jgi:hypothetical protein
MAEDNGEVKCKPISHYSVKYAEEVNQLKEMNKFVETLKSLRRKQMQCCARREARKNTELILNSKFILFSLIK